MEGNKKVGKSSSFASELFGPKNGSSSSPSSAELFGSIFTPPLGLGVEAIRSEWVGKKQDHPETEALNSKPDDTFKSGEGDRRSTPAMDYYDQSVHPCHLSSSIFYGGQDIYNPPVNYQAPSTNSAYKKDATEEDPGIASRGNWWQGSLYY